MIDAEKEKAMIRRLEKQYKCGKGTDKDVKELSYHFCAWVDKKAEEATKDLENACRQAKRFFRQNKSLRRLEPDEREQLAPTPEEFQEELQEKFDKLMLPLVERVFQRAFEPEHGDYFPSEMIGKVAICELEDDDGLKHYCRVASYIGNDYINEYLEALKYERKLNHYSAAANCFLLKPIKVKFKGGEVSIWTRNSITTPRGRKGRYIVQPIIQVTGAPPCYERSISREFNLAMGQTTVLPESLEPSSFDEVLSAFVEFNAE